MNSSRYPDYVSYVLPPSSLFCCPFFLPWCRYSNSKSFSRIRTQFILLISQTVQSLSCVRLFANPWTAARQACLLSITNSWSLLKLMSIALVMPFSHLILCHPLLLPPIFPSIRVFSNESVLLIAWPKYWEFQLQHLSFQWIFRTDFLKDGLVGSPCCPRDSQESSPTPQFGIH